MMRSAYVPAPVERCLRSPMGAVRRAVTVVDPIVRPMMISAVASVRALSNLSYLMGVDQLDALVKSQTVLLSTPSASGCARAERCRIFHRDAPFLVASAKSQSVPLMTRCASGLAPQERCRSSRRSAVNLGASVMPLTVLLQTPFAPGFATLEICRRCLWVAMSLDVTAVVAPSRRAKSGAITLRAPTFSIVERLGNPSMSVSGSPPSPSRPACATAMVVARTQAVSKIETVERVAGAGLPREMGGNACLSRRNESPVVALCPLTWLFAVLPDSSAVRFRQTCLMLRAYVYLRTPMAIPLMVQTVCRGRLTVTRAVRSSCYGNVSIVGWTPCSVARRCAIS
jgi:hypothetical protein